MQEKQFTVPEAQPFFHHGGENGILLLHGFTGSAAHMRPLAEALAQAGVTVKTINLPGHAQTPEKMTSVTAEDWLCAAREAVHDLRKMCSHVTVSGLSMGGVISLILAGEGEADRVIPISAPMPAKNPLLPVSGLLAPIVPKLNFGKDKARIAALDQRYDLGYAVCPSVAASQLHRIIQMGKQALPKVTCPLLCIQSHADQAISPKSASNILNGVSSKTREMLWLEDVPHVCTISKEKNTIFQHILDFIVPKARKSAP